MHALFYGKIRLDGLDKENIKQWQRFEDFQILRTKAEEETEARSRKLFLEEIGSKLDITNEEEFRNGMKKYRSITRSFVHSYDGEILNILPGLKESVVLLQITRMQEDLLNEVKKLRLRSVISDYVDTLINIHPSLLLEVEIPRNSLSIDDEKLQQMRNDPSGGGKVQFILDMANRCQLTKEKLLIFSQYIAPLRLMKEHLEGRFKVFFITGKSLVLERQDIMESFNDGNGGTQILLASLTACGEGINLTGASRVIFLDMHWNPSRMKQASSRAFRIGQKNVVYTYWLIASGEKEANKYTRIEKKASLSRSITASKAEECGHKQQENNTNAPNAVGEDVILDDLVKNSALKIIDVVRRSAMEEEDNLSALLRQ
jgi:DNA repair and recombination RAD54-like protein